MSFTNQFNPTSLRRHGAPLVPAAGRYERIAKGGTAVTKGMSGRVRVATDGRAKKVSVLKNTRKNSTAGQGLFPPCKVLKRGNGSKVVHIQGKNLVQDKLFVAKEGSCK